MSTYNKIDELSKSIDNLRDKYVPGSGKADTVGGEIIRALDRLLYRFYNDGDQVGEGYGIETCNSSYRYLSKKVENCPRLAYESYEDSLLKLTEITTSYLLAHKELFKTENTEDSREISEQDREDMRRWEEEDNEIDDDWEDEYERAEWDDEEEDLQ